LVEMAVELDPLQVELLGQRERYNTLYALAKRARPRLEQERFKHNLFTFAKPLISAAKPDARARLVSVLYELTLELTGVELFARSEAVRAVWVELLPSAPELVVESPEVAIASLTNAAYNLEQEPGADWPFWFQQMSQIAPACESLQQWLELAQLMSWVSGMAHYQSSALELAKRLPESLTEKVVPRWDKVKSDPWWARRPEPGQMIRVHRVGGFVGYGGVFRRPPEIVAAGKNRFLVSDWTDDWLLFCDGFGATLKRVVDFALEDLEPTDIRVQKSGEILWAGERAEVPEAVPVSSFDSTGLVVAVAGKLSHDIHIMLGTPPK
jgi:hypothetical protein